MSFRFGFLVLLASLLARPCPAQPPSAPERAAIRGESAQTRKRLAEAGQKIAMRQPAEAIDDLQRILDESGDDLVAVEGGRFRPARDLAQELLAKLPAEALATYRDRIDGPARKLLEAAQRDRDTRPLWTLLDRYFVSRPAEEGLRLLGDLLFEQGDSRRAEEAWRRLLPAGQRDGAYPSPSGDLSAIQARLVLAAIFQGEAARAKTELQAFRSRYPDAAGPLAGRTGPYVSTLQDLLEHPPVFPPSARPARSWPTFGGGPSRDGRVPGHVAIHWPGRPTWAIALPFERVMRVERPSAAGMRPPLGDPIIADGRAYVSDGSRVFSVDLLTGILRTLTLDDGAPSDPPADPGLSSAPPPRPATTLTWASGRLFVRLGPAVVWAGARTTLACLGPSDSPTPSGFPLQVRWQGLRPPAVEGKGASVWEGAPLVADRRLWAAMARFEGGRVIHSIACYDPADADERPDHPAWVTELCDGPAPLGPDARVRQDLLTRAGRHVVFCSHAGAVMAVEAATGRKAWAFRYPRTSKSAAAFADAAGPAPAVYHAGRIFVAPADADRIFALDAETGEPLWESGHCEGGRILGVTQGRVVVTVAGAVRGIRALSERSGSHEDGGWVQHRAGIPIGYGHGFVTENAVVWPTRAGVFFLRPETGDPLAEPFRPYRDPRDSFRPASALGHVAYADGCLVAVVQVVVDGLAQDQLWVYVSEARRHGLEGKPAGASEPEGKPMPDRRQAKFERTIDRVEALVADGKKEEAQVLLREMAESPGPAAHRAWAAARFRQITNRALPNLPADVREEWLILPTGRPESLDDFLTGKAGRGEKSLPRPLSSSREVPPEVVPGLAPTAGVERSMALPQGSAPLLVLPGVAEMPRALIVARGTELQAIRTDSGEATLYEAPAAFSHFGDLAGGFVAAGPRAVAVYGAGRSPEWTFRVPEIDLSTPRPGPAILDGSFEYLSSFALAGAWLFARLGEHHLLALDLAGRRVAWIRSADGRPRYVPFGFPDRARFGPRLACDGRVVLAALSSGCWLVIEAATGRMLKAEPDLLAAWTAAPTPLDARSWLVPSEAGRVQRYDATNGRAEWTFTAGGATSLSGEPPQVRLFGPAAIVAVRRNFGLDLDRLDPYLGRSVWPGGPVFLDADRISLAQADADGMNLYLPVGDAVRAIRLADGQAAWEASLPAAGAAGWVARAGRRVVIVHPAEAIPESPVGDVVERLALSFFRRPLPHRLPGLAATLYHAWADRRFPVLLLDPATGRMLKRIDVPARGPFATTWFERDAAIVATGDRFVWLK